MATSTGVVALGLVGVGEGLLEKVAMAMVSAGMAEAPFLVEVRMQVLMVLRKRPLEGLGCKIHGGRRRHLEGRSIKVVSSTYAVRRRLCHLKLDERQLADGV